MKGVLLVTDRIDVVRRVRDALRHAPGLPVLGLANGHGSLRDQLRVVRPSVVIVDGLADEQRVLGALREAADSLPEALRVLLTIGMDDRQTTAALEAGATTVLAATTGPIVLGTILREITQGRVVHTPPRAPSATAADQCPLTNREREILQLAAQGMTNGNIARTLFVTEQTVKFHLSNTYRKLGVANRTEASRYAHVTGLVARRMPAPASAAAVS